MIWLSLIHPEMSPMTPDMETDEDFDSASLRPRIHTRTKSDTAQCPRRRSQRLAQKYGTSSSELDTFPYVNVSFMGRAFARLPKEIMGEIFLEACRDDCATTPAFDFTTLAPLRLSHVSRLWRLVALGTPGLWSNLQVTVRKSRIDSALELVKLWVPRSRHLPLTISVAFNSAHEAVDLYASDTLSHFRVIAKTAELLRNELTRRAGKTLMESHLKAASSGTTPILEERYVWYYGVGEDGVPLPQLGRATPDLQLVPLQVRGIRRAVDEFALSHHAPFRSTLTRLELRDTNGITCLSPSELPPIIAYFPRLQWLEAFLDHGGLDDDDQALEAVFAPAIKTFKLGWAFMTNPAALFDALTMPSLTELELSGDLIRGPTSWTHLFDFFVRSRPPIRTFALEHFDATAVASRLADCLALLPDLDSLWLENCVMDDDFILSLARSRTLPEMLQNTPTSSPNTPQVPDNVLSRLRTFGIVSSDDISGDAVVRAFSLATSDRSPFAMKEIFIFDCVGILEPHCTAITALLEDRTNVESILVSPGDAEE